MTSQIEQGRVAHGVVTRIDQVLPTLASQDAIGDHVIQMQSVLRSCGYQSDIFYGDATTDRIDAGLHVGRIGDHPVESRALLYHLSIGSWVSDIFRDRPERKFVYYHNITPAELLTPWLPYVEAQVRQARSQLHELAPITEFAMAASAFNERELIDAGYRSTTTSPLLIDLERFNGRPDPLVTARLDANRIVGGVDLLFVGKVSPHKGQADLVKALSAYRAAYDPLARLHLVGGVMSEQYQQTVEAFAAKLGLADAIEFTGSVTHEELIAYYQGCQVFVCLSNHEGFCVPLVEAMYHDLPIVTWERAAIPETVTGAGLILDRKDPPLVSAAIDRVVRDDGLRRSLSEGAAERLSSYSLQQTSDIFVHAIEAAVESRHLRPALIKTNAPDDSGRFDQVLIEIEDEVRLRYASGDFPPSHLMDLDALFLESGPEGPQRKVHMHHPLTVATALRLLFPTTQPGELTSLANQWGGETEVQGLSDLRLLLGSVDHETFFSPVEVHIGQEDIVVVEVDGISLALDRHDHAVSRPIIDGRGHDPWLANIASDFCGPGMTVVDVGANVGYFTMLAWAAVGNEGRVVAVEPRSDNCRLLLLSAGLNSAFSIELLPVAADRNRGLAHLGVAIGTNGGFVPDDPSALLDGRAVIVPTFPLDELVDGPVHLIKVDVEGAEGRVMEGAASIISAYRPVVVTELCPAMLEAVSDVTCEDYLSRFVDLAFDIHEINPTERTMGPAEGLKGLMDRWGDRESIRNLILVPRATSA